MPSFKKVIKTDITEIQREAINRACKADLFHWVNVEGYDVVGTIVADKNGSGIIVSFSHKVEGSDYAFDLGSVEIGPKGGITYNGLK